MSDELLLQLMAGTGPLGTIIVASAVWVRGEFRQVRTILKNHEARIRRREGVPQAAEDSDPTAPLAIS